jgi:sec-independent protein translocase protein TatC
MSDGRELSVIEHIDELRKRIVYCVFFFIFSFLISYSLSSEVLKFIVKNLGKYKIANLVFFSPYEAFGIYIKITFLISFIFTSPFVFYQIYKYIEPALKEELKEKILYIIVSIYILFFTGIFISYYIIIPPALKFLINFGTSYGFEPLISVSKYVEFIFYLSIIMGLIFQMPLISYFLAKFKLINSRILRKNYKFSIILILIIAAIITPTGDIINLLLFSMPMILLYELSIWMVKINEK